MSHRLDRDPGTPPWLTAWRDEPLAPTPRTPVEASRQIQHVAATLKKVAEARRRRRYLQQIAAGVAVAAAAVGLWLGGSQLLSSKSPASAQAELNHVRLRAEGPVQITGASGQPLRAEAPLDAGATVQTQLARAKLEFASGASCELSQQTRVRIAETGARRHETLALAAGRVDVEVPKRSDPVVFSVQTPEALVVVHGTRFSVEVDPERPSGGTRVAVTRGVVMVHARGQDVRLTAGQRWPAPEAAPDLAPDAPEASDGDFAEPTEVEAAPAKASPRARPAPARKPPRARGPAPRAAQSSDETQLAEENRLFAAAMNRKKAGDAAAALRDIERFLQKYPDSVLKQEAEVERFRLLSRLGRSKEAARRARTYLGDYRDGYAREEARDVALERP